MGYKITVEIDAHDLPYEVIDEITREVTAPSVEFNVWRDGIDAVLPVCSGGDIMCPFSWDDIEYRLIDMAKSDVWDPNGNPLRRL